MNMAMRKNFAQAYANTAVESIVTEASPHKLVEMLYDNALKNLKLAKIFIERNEFEKKAEHLNKSMATFAELKAGIDLDSGKDVAENLLALYDYCHSTIFQASAQNDVQKIDEVIGLIEPISEAWKQMPEQYKRANREQIQKMKA